MTHFFAIAFLTAVLALKLAVAAPSAKMDSYTSDALIEKLETLLPELTTDKSESETVRLRLADLYSDRARMKDISVNEQSCKNCPNGDLDRKKAITLYEQSRDAANTVQLSHLSLQLGHLYHLIGEIDKSDKAYKSILKNPSLKLIHAKAQLGVADILYEKGNFLKAIPEFEKAFVTTVTEDQIYIQYRIAWCHFNSSSIKNAIAHIQNAIRIARDNKNDGWYGDLMRDYATLLSHGQFGATEIETFAGFSKPEERNQNLKFLGEEAERLGNKKAALLIWRQYLQTDKTEDKAEIHLKLAQNFYDLNRYTQTLVYLDLTTQAIKKDKCEDCKKVLADFRSMIVNWNKKEKTSPSNELTQAYEKYLSLADKDFEAMVWAAQVAIQLKHFSKATAFYRDAARIAKPEHLEAITSAMIDAAEESKDQKLREASLNEYLELNPNGKQKFEVRYQIAYIKFQDKNFSDAFSEFNKLALENKWADKKLKYQAANLAIDSLTALKKDSDIRSTAEEYAEAFPENKKHYTEISRRVTVNNVVTLPIEDSDLPSELKRLSKYDVEYLKPDEQVRHFKTIALAAEKLKDYDVVLQTSQKILKIRKANPNDIGFARKSVLWAYEQQKDFKNAYAAALVAPLGLSKDQRFLKLGLLAEQAGENPTPHFRDYLKATSAVRTANEIRVKMIRLDPKLYDRMKTALARSPDLLGIITLELHLKKPNWQNVRSALKIAGVRSTPYGRFMETLLNRKASDQAETAVRTYKINSKNLKISIKQKIKLLDSLTRIYKQSLKTADLPLQLKTLKTIATENRKFHQQLNTMVPKNLKKKEREMYQSMLAQQSAPFLVTAQDAERNIEKFSSANAKALEELENAKKSENLLDRQIALHEFSSLKPYADGTLLAYLDEQIAQIRARARR